MPHKRGPGTHAGYMSPPTGSHSASEKHIVRIVYGECRKKSYPEETQESKSRCARIAWAAARKYG